MWWDKELARHQGQADMVAVTQPYSDSVAFKLLQVYEIPDTIFYADLLRNAKKLAHQLFFCSQVGVTPMYCMPTHRPSLTGPTWDSCWELNSVYYMACLRICTATRTDLLLSMVSAGVDLLFREPCQILYTKPDWIHQFAKEQIRCLHFFETNQSFLSQTVNRSNLSEYGSKLEL